MKPMTDKISFEQECDDCNGTGLYQGMAEHSGYAVVCSTCDGKGWYRFEHTYNKFTGRKKRKDIKRVLQINVGISVGISEKYPEGYFGGVPYDEWEKTGKFPKGSEMRNCTCPACWYQNADNEKKPEWKECTPVGSFSDCSSFTTKDACWVKWDKTFGRKK